MAVLRAVLGPLVIDAILGVLFMRSVLLREGSDRGGRGGVVYCDSHGRGSDVHGHKTFIHSSHEHI